MSWRSMFPSERLYNDPCFVRLDEARQNLLLRLYSRCDKWGRGPAEERMLALHLLLFRPGLRDDLNALAKAGFVEVYTVESEDYYQLPNYDEDQFADMLRKRGKSVFPEPQKSTKPALDKGQARSALRADKGQTKGSPRADQGQAKSAVTADQGQASSALMAGEQSVAERSGAQQSPSSAAQSSSISDEPADPDERPAMSSALGAQPTPDAVAPVEEQPLTPVPVDRAPESPAPHGGALETGADEPWWHAVPGKTVTRAVSEAEWQAMRVWRTPANKLWELFQTRARRKTPHPYEPELSRTAAGLQVTEDFAAALYRAGEQQAEEVIALFSEYDDVTWRWTTAGLAVEELHKRIGEGVFDFEPYRDWGKVVQLRRAGGEA